MTSVQLLAEFGSLSLIPPTLGADFFFGPGFGPNDFGHRLKISFSILRRTSSQSEVVVRPASRSAQRRSISGAHSASTSRSFS